MKECVDCGIDISDRGVRAVRCVQCSAPYQRMMARRRHALNKAAKACRRCERMHRRKDSYCSDQCRTMAKQAAAPKGRQYKSCEAPDCHNLFVTVKHRIYCGDHCSKRARAIRLHPWKNKTCGICQTVYEVRGHGSTRSRLCSDKCRWVQRTLKQTNMIGDPVWIRTQMDFKFCQSCGRTIEDNRKVAGRHIDHDHVTKVFRGVICGRCNLAAGMFTHPDQIRGLAAYLERTTPIPAVEMYPDSSTE